MMTQNPNVCPVPNPVPNASRIHEPIRTDLDTKALVSRQL